MRYSGLKILGDRARRAMGRLQGVVHCQSMKRELTDSSLEIRRIVSASSSAMLTWRMGVHSFASSDKGIVLVTTSSSS
jgi:hypothetical protein